MSPAWVWAGALILYGAFSLWYNSWPRGPLSPEEIEGYVEHFDSSPEATPERSKVVRDFLAADDGGEFFMVNLIRMHEGEVAAPGEDPAPASTVLDRYTRHILPALFRRAGHPVLLGPAAGRYVEHWGVEADPGWSLVGVMRYRSRRDMMEIATDPAFGPAHVYKIAAIANTLAFPIAPPVLVFGPRVWVGLGLALLAALGHLALRSFGSR